MLITLRSIGIDEDRDRDPKVVLKEKKYETKAASGNQFHRVALSLTLCS